MLNEFKEKHNNTDEELVIKSLLKLNIDNKALEDYNQEFTRIAKTMLK
jgi:hypothetical protein